MMKTNSKHISLEDKFEDYKLKIKDFLPLFGMGNYIGRLRGVRNSDEVDQYTAKALAGLAIYNVGFIAANIWTLVYSLFLNE